jgi:hypothetical protein
MQPGAIRNHTRDMGKPADWDEEKHGPCKTLKIRDDLIEERYPVMWSAWLPTPEEMEAIAKGAPIHLAIVGTSHPPVWIEVGDPPPPEKEG